MLSAQEAAQKSEKALINCTTIELAIIEKRINKAVSNGERRVYEDSSISPDAKRTLENLGYKVEVGSQYNQNYYVIKW